jgi:hypothetical protein
MFQVSYGTGATRRVTDAESAVRALELGRQYEEAGYLFVMVTDEAGRSYSLDAFERITLGLPAGEVFWRLEPKVGGVQPKEAEGQNFGLQGDQRRG